MDKDSYKNNSCFSSLLTTVQFISYTTHIYNESVLYELNNKMLNVSITLNGSECSRKIKKRKKEDFIVAACFNFKWYEFLYIICRSCV